MTMVKKLITASIFGILLVSPAAFAQGTSTVTSTPREASSTESHGSALTKANRACMQAAMTKRDTAVKAAQSARKQALESARLARQASLAALGNSTSTIATSTATSTAKALLRAQKKAIEKAYADAVKAAQKAYRDATKAAQDQYKLDRQACKSAPSAPSVR